MAYETITVRMNRSSATIPWGIAIKSAVGGALAIASVEKDSLADKAGVEVNDTIKQLAGRLATTMSLSEARNAIERASDQIYMVLERYITAHPSLPWTLTEQDNKIVVDHLPTAPQNLSTYKSLQGNETRNQFSAHSTSSYEIPTSQRYDSGIHHRSPSPHPVFSKDRKEGRNVPIGYQAAPFTNVTNSQSLDTSAQQPVHESFYKSSAADSYTKRETHLSDHQQSAGFGGGGGFKPEIQQQRHDQTIIGGGGGGEHRNVPIALSYKSSSGVTTTQQPPSMAPSWHQHQHPTPDHTVHSKTFVTPENVVHSGGGGYGRGGGGGSPFGHKPQVSPFRQTLQSRTRSETSYHDEGPHVAFQHSPRTRRQLSPSASIRHLQYNSPMNLYSKESAAEQYHRQTGGALFGGDKLIHTDSTHVESIHHVPAPQKSPAIVKPIADRATPTSGGPVFASGAGGGQAIPLGSAPAIPLPDSSGSIPAPLPPPPPTAASSYPHPHPTSNTTTAILPTAKSPSARHHEPSSHATIRHLQYNSPMNIYSMESAAEQYRKQTGGLFGTETDPNKLKSHDPSYLHSATRRLIEEEERGIQRESSVPAQSSSFKRISAACGTPVE